MSDETAESLARALDPEAFEDHDIERRSTIAAIQWAARRHMATEGAKKVLASDWLAAHDREKQAEALEQAAANLKRTASDTYNARGDENDINWTAALDGVHQAVAALLVRAAEYRNTGNTEGGEHA
jgi:hypothetical protein